jgi:drug/metabolite transporter (DMT)-like permease
MPWPGNTMQLSSNLRGILSMMLSGLSFVCCDSFLKLMLVDVPPFQTLVLRGIFATICCFGLVVAMGELKHLSKAFNVWTMLRSLAEVFAVSAFILSLAVVPLATVTAIYQVAPLIVLVGASFLWGEKIGFLRWLLILLGLAGALVVAQPWRDGASLMALLGFFTAFASAGRDLLSRKTPNDAPGIVVTFNVVVLVWLSAIINNQLFGEWKPVSAHTWLYGLGAGFFVMLGHLFVFLAFRYATARAVAPFYYSFTLIAAAFGALFLNEYPNWLALTGMAMIITCGLGVLYFESDEKAET